MSTTGDGQDPIDIHLASFLEFFSALTKKEINIEQAVVMCSIFGLFKYSAYPLIVTFFFLFFYAFLVRLKNERGLFRCFYFYR